MKRGDVGRVDEHGADHEREEDQERVEAEPEDAANDEPHAVTAVTVSRTSGMINNTRTGCNGE